MALEKNMPMMTKRGDMMMIPKKIILIVDWLIRSWPVEKRLPDMIKNCQKNPNMVPIEPKRSPKAKGSLNPPLKFMVRKSFSGEKRTALKVWYIPFQMPSSDRFSHGETPRPTSLSFSIPFCSWEKLKPFSGKLISNRLLQCGQVAHPAPTGICSAGIVFEKLQLGQVMSIVISFSLSPG
jgi:hypothetical protein